MLAVISNFQGSAQPPKKLQSGLGIINWFLFFLLNLFLESDFHLEVIKVHLVFLHLKLHINKVLSLLHNNENVYT